MKKSLTKRFLAVILLAALIVGLMPAAAFAEEYLPPAATSGVCGDNLTWDLVDGTLTISGAGAMYNYTEVDLFKPSAPWFENKDSIQKIVIEDGVTSVGDYAFMSLDITEAELPDSLTSIGKLSFSHCPYLSSISIPSGTIGTSAFTNCDNLTHVTIGADVDEIGYGSFNDCSALYSITISNGVESINNWAFAACDKLTTLNIPQSVKYIGEYLMYTVNDETRTIKFWGNAPEFNTNAFVGLKGTVYYPESDATWTTDVRQQYSGSVTWKGYATSGKCGDNLTWKLDDGVLTISGTGDMYDYTNKSDAPWYVNKENIQKIIIEDGVTSVGDFAFQNLNIKEVELPDSLTSIGGGSFSYCSKLYSISIPSGTIGDTAFAFCTNLADVEFGAGVDEIGNSSFYNCSDLYNVKFRNGVELIGDWAFAACADLETLNIPQSVRYIGEYLMYTETDETRTLNFWGSAPEFDENAFTGLKGTVTYPESDATWTSSVKQQYGGTVAWEGYATSGKCGDNLTWNLNNNTLTISGTGDMYDLTSDDFDAAGWQVVYEQAKKIVVEEGVTRIGDYVFYLMTELEKAELPDTLESIGAYAFSECDALTEITVPSGTIEDYAFSWCYGLKNVIISKNVERIGEGAFYRLKSLSSLTISEGVQYIDSYAFAYAPITSITIPSTVKAIGRGFASDPGNEERELKVSFLGAAPQLHEEAFFSQKVLAQYSVGEDSWTDDVKQQYGGTVRYSAKGLDTPENTKITVVSSSGKPKLTWDAVTGAQKYEIWRKTGSGGTYTKMYTQKTTTYTNTTAVPGKTYYYKVRALDKDGFKGKFSSGYSAVCKLAQPSNVTITTAAASGKPKLTWTAVSGADKYEIWRKTGSSGTYTKMYTQKSTSYTNTTAVAGKTYYYKVRAIDEDNSAATSVYSAVKSITCDLAQPANLKITTVASSGKPKLTWTAVAGADKYEIWRKTGSNGTYTRMYTQKSTSYTNTSAVAGKTYYYKVKAIDADNSYANSAFSAVKSITCDLAQPKNLKISLSASGRPKLTWTAVSGADKYEIWRKTGSGGTYKKMYTQKSTSYTNTIAEAGKTYYYKVRAIDADNSYAASAYSAVKSITSK